MKPLSQFQRIWLMLSVLLIACYVLAGCAATPEAILKRGYDSSSATVRSTTALVQRDAISTADAQNVHTLGTTAKATLDVGKEDLKKCRAAGGDCKAIANINLGAGVLTELEKYLKVHEGSK